MSGEEQPEAVPDALRTELRSVLAESLDEAGVRLAGEELERVVEDVASLISPVLRDLQMIATSVVALSRHADSLPISYQKLAEVLTGIHELAELIAGPEPEPGEG